MSFYIILTSNSSMELFPNNTMTDFTVILKEPLRLDIQYEVAFVELTNKHSWSLQVGRMIVRLTNEYFYDAFFLVYHDGENIKSFVNRLNGEVSEYYIKKEYNRRYDLFEANSAESISLTKTEYNNRDKESNIYGEEHYPLLTNIGLSDIKYDTVCHNLSNPIYVKVKCKIDKLQLGLQDGEGLYLKPGPNSSECIKSELDLFLTPSTNTSIVNGGWFEINSTSSPGSPIEFRYEGSNNHYL
ncbi:unnamed protein product [Brachionus calyciflorus]|uniref:Uncharacterized protein n=1 Tax=Brachionus calyciflorus TaxID=104777 RepID=A0A813ZSY6_9BILA|nr:unnamed protein product [Brachionus calyciflorus]